MLGTDLLGSYLIGSLAHAGFSHRYSDIDIALVTAAGLSIDALDNLRSEAVALSPDWGAKVSVFWADRHFSHGRFLPLDRIDYLDHAITLTERERVRPRRPTLEEIRDYLRGMPFSGWAERARTFAAAETLDPKDRKAPLWIEAGPPSRFREGGGRWPARGKLAAGRAAGPAHTRLCRKRLEPENVRKLRGQWAGFA